MSKPLTYWVVMAEWLLFVGSTRCGCLRTPTFRNSVPQFEHVCIATLHEHTMSPAIEKKFGRMMEDV